MDRRERVAQLQFRYKVTLPATYRAFLETHDGQTHYSFHGHKGEAWCLWSAFEADWPGRYKAAFDSPSGLEGATLFQFVALAGDGALRKAITIGSENATYLYIDPRKDNSVWQYHPDDQTTERVAASFEEWLSKAKPITNAA